MAMTTKTKNLAGGFAVCGCIIIIAFLGLVNLITGSSYPWFIFPSFAVMWWPLSIIVPRGFGAKTFSIWGCVLLISTLAVINLITSPSFLWVIYPILALLWWPLSVIVPRRFGAKAFSICGCLLIIVTLAVTNFMTNRSFLWVIYPMLALLWWPLAVIVPRRFGAKAFSVCGCLLIIVTLAVINFITNRSFLWVIYPILALLWWPLAVIVPRKFGAKAFSICGCVLLIGTFAVINLITSPSYLWFIYPTLALLWWPLAAIVPHRFGANTFAICGFLSVITFLFIVNQISNPSYLWFIYPTLALLWWPLSVIVPRKFGAKGFSICGCLLLIGTLAVINLITNPSYLWVIYPALVLLWWPLSVIVPRKLGAKAFSICGCFLLIFTLAVINLITNPFYLWVIYPALVLLWWPLSVIVPGKLGTRAFSIWGCVLLIGTLAVINLITNPSYLWCIYPAFALLWWPLSVILPSKLGSKTFSIFGFLLITTFLCIVNHISSPSYLWFIYPTLALMWWPLSVIVPGKVGAKAFSICGCVLLIGTFAVINFLSEPSYLWFIYPSFAILWWPLSVIVPSKLGAKAFSICSCVLIIAFICIVNRISNPNYLWVLYTLMPIVLWPLCLFVGKRANTVTFASLILLIITLYYTALNMFFTHGFPWCIFIIYVAMWLPLSLIFARKGHLLAFSISGTIATSCIIFILNMLTTPNVIWFVYPVFAILWWPLSTYFFVYKKAHID